MSLIRLANVPEAEATGESRTNIRKPAGSPRVHVARRLAIRSGDGQRTSYAQPAASSHRITRALVSISPRWTPCRADVGSAWRRLCHDSPIEGMASHQTLTDRSRVLN